MATWDDEQLANARLIIAVGLEMRMTQRDILIALMAAMQESSLRNVTGGDRDSAGLFQQRPSQGWGTYEQVTDPLYAAKKFFSTLKGVRNRGRIPLAAAAQAVQRSAYPGAYSNWENDAIRLLNSNGGDAGLPYPLNVPAMSLLDPMFRSTTQQPQQVEPLEALAAPTVEGLGADEPGLESVMPEPDQLAQAAQLGELGGQEQPVEFPAVQGFTGGLRSKLIDALKQYLGVPYQWGGTSLNGVDCSGLIYAVYNRLGVKVPRVSGQQAMLGDRAAIASLMPGDFVVWGSDAHHIAVYLGDGQILEAPNSGNRVRIRAIGDGENAWGVHLNLGGD